MIIRHQTLFFPHWDDHCYLNSTVGVMNSTIDFLDQVISLKFNIDSCQTNQNGLQLTISLRVEEWLTLKPLQGTPIITRGRGLSFFRPFTASTSSRKDFQLYNTFTNNSFTEISSPKLLAPVLAHQSFDMWLHFLPSFLNVFY